MTSEICPLGEIEAHLNTLKRQPFNFFSVLASIFVFDALKHHYCLTHTFLFHLSPHFQFPHNSFHPPPPLDTPAQSNDILYTFLRCRLYKIVDVGHRDGTYGISSLFQVYHKWQRKKME